MNREQIHALPGRYNPVLCYDGKFGILEVYPRPGEDLCGIRVYGECELRWVAPRDLNASGMGALRQCGAANPRIGDLQDDDPTQSVLAMDWVQRGGKRIAG